MAGEQTFPLWLWRAAGAGFVLLLAAVAGLAGLLSLGLADAPRAGPLQWADDFRAGPGRWSLKGTQSGSTYFPVDGGLFVDFNSADEWQAALAAAPAGDFTLEAGGAQTDGGIGARYGLTFAWRDAQNHSAALINGNGYVEVYRLHNGARQDWFEWQQWPHILAGTDANRVRVDVRGSALTVRVNDEVVVRATDVDADGQLGVLARGVGPGQVTFSWVKLWAP